MSQNSVGLSETTFDGAVDGREVAEVGGLAREEEVVQWFGQRFRRHRSCFSGRRLVRVRTLGERVRIPPSDLSIKTNNLIKGFAVWLGKNKYLLKK